MNCNLIPFLSTSGTECGIAENQVGLVWVDETDPAKFTVSFQTADGHERDGGGMYVLLKGEWHP